MKIIAWNVNGIRSLLKTNNLNELISNYDPDVLCIGETKISCLINIEDEIKEKLSFKYVYSSPCKVKAGYSGTAIFCKKKPINIIYGLIGHEIDDEGRVISVEYKNFWIIHVYTPNSGQELARLNYRVKEWDVAFIHHINKLQETKQVIICGDLNVAHKEIDIKNPKANLKTAGYTIEERNSFNKLLESTNLIDCYRNKNPEIIKYSYWSYRFNSRKKNVGWRIDYFLLSNKLFKKVDICDILVDIMGSDHAPIYLKL